MWILCHPTRPIFQEAIQPKQSGLTVYLESTLLELLNDAKFVEILVNTTENTIRYSKPPYKFVGHMTASNLLCVVCGQLHLHHCHAAERFTMYNNQTLFRGHNSVQKGTIYRWRRAHAVTKRIVHTIAKVIVCEQKNRPS